MTAGVCALLILSFIPEGSLSERMAITALIALVLAAVVGWFELLTTQRVEEPMSAGQQSGQYWPAVTLGVALLAALAVQTWFQPGSSVASGDLPPPAGTAWLGRLFVGAALGIFGLLAALRMSPVAAVAGTAVYVLSPFVISYVTINTVYLAALGLLAAIPAAVVAAGTGRISVRLGVVLIAMTAPFIGYVDLNPPLVGMLLGAMAVTPLVVAWVDGRQAARRSVRTVLLAVPLLLAASAYWIVPSIIHLSAVVTSQLAPVFTYFMKYESFPLSGLRFVLPAVAFGALALGAISVPRPPDKSKAIAKLESQLVRLGQRFEWGHIAENDYRAEWERLDARRARLLTPQNAAVELVHEFPRRRGFRLALAAATAALAIIFLSTGTNPPGNTVFDRLYALPFGWLLREPGRFLVVAALAYAVLVAVVVEVAATSSWIARLVRGHRGWAQRSRLGVGAATLALSMALGFPVYTGAVVPDSRPQLPPAHVHVPGYWTEMARSVDGLPTQGSMLIMPPDDFYAMPYSWGYYGTDDFIPNFFHRRVVIPNGQGYSPATSQL